MIVTEEAARELWCPQTRKYVYGYKLYGGYGGMGYAASINRDDKDNANCKASDCMMWVSQFDGKGHCGLIK